MTEKIIRRIAEATGLESSLRTEAGGGVALYPAASEKKAVFMDGGSLEALTVKARFKGVDPSLLFKTAESACATAESYSGSGFRLKVESRPVMESSNENGMHIVSCRFVAEHVTEGNGIRVVYVNSDGTELDMSCGSIRAVSAGGILPYRSVYIDESGIFDGGSIVSERCGTRRIKLRLALCGGFSEAEGRLSEIFGRGGEGALYFYRSGVGRRIGCFAEDISSENIGGTDFAEVSLLCPYPFFESIEERSFQICGTENLTEFDDWELTEENETELSALKAGNSVFAENNGGYEAGCVIAVEVLRSVSGLRAVNADTKEFIGVRGSFAPGDIVYFRTGDGDKGIFLSAKYDLSKNEDITSRIVWGSSFFKIAPGGSRIYIVSDGGTDGLSAQVTFTERSEGF